MFRESLSREDIIAQFGIINEAIKLINMNQLAINGTYHPLTDIDPTPTQGSSNLITSNAVYDAIAGNQLALRISVAEAVFSLLQPVWYEADDYFNANLLQTGVTNQGSGWQTLQFGVVDYGDDVKEVHMRGFVVCTRPAATDPVVIYLPHTMRPQKRIVFPCGMKDNLGMRIDVEADGAVRVIQHSVNPVNVTFSGVRFFTN